jgi:hypothetical protein
MTSICIDESPLVTPEKSQTTSAPAGPGSGTDSADRREYISPGFAMEDEVIVGCADKMVIVAQNIMSINVFMFSNFSKKNQFIAHSKN